jgi:hypothetical protein
VKSEYGDRREVPIPESQSGDEILDLRRRKPEADVVSNPYSVRIGELRFQHGADFLKVVVALLAVESGQKTFSECFQPTDEVSGQRCWPRDSGKCRDVCGTIEISPG